MAGPAILGAVATAVDRGLTRRWTRPVHHSIDDLPELLSRAADHSVLWLAIAAGASSGGTRSRRAAGHGVLALAVTSTTVNGPLKLLFGRRRPAGRRRLRRRLRTSSFPSGHSASGFAFAVAASRELPDAGPVLLALAAGVAHSRVYLGVHYPTDVLAGAAIGTAVGLATRSAVRGVRMDVNARRPGSPRRARSPAVLVISPHAGNSHKLARARRALERCGVRVDRELDIAHVDELAGLLHTEDGASRLVIAAGGDGTVGAVAGHLLCADNELGILPLGTGNDIARALGIPLSVRRAAEQLAVGTITRSGLGRVIRPGQEPQYFAHAATAGLNVDFARLATRASVRARLGRLTYLVAALYAVRERTVFRCALDHDGAVDELDLLQLSVISAPVIGGALGLNVRGPFPDDHRLDVLAVEDGPPLKMLRAGIFLLLGITRRVPGILALHVDAITVSTHRSLPVALDGEPDGNLPARFEAVPDVLRVIVPPRPPS